MNGIDCSIHGSSKWGSKTYYLNELKNRYNFPSPNEMDSTVTIDKLIKSADPNQYSTGKGIRIKGYVFKVKSGGIETCNCRSKDQFYRDTHIELTADGEHTGPQFRIIVEVTPRIRQIMSKNGIDWSTGSIKKTLTGKNIIVTGWLLYDFEHEDGSYANDPDDNAGRPNWRASCWEVHPVTSITIEGNVENNPMPPPEKKINNKISNAPVHVNYVNEQGNSRALFIFIGVLILTIIIIVILLMRKR